MLLSDASHFQKFEGVVDMAIPGYLSLRNGASRF